MTAADELRRGVRHRRGRQPHLVTVTAEPLPTRLASIARGTGEVDAVYHIAFDALAASVTANAARLHRPGVVKILSLKSRTAYSLTGATGKTRLAWTVIGRLPVVQCVEVRRTGNAVAGIDIALLSLSAPIGNEADC